jgi:hypothetical protein
MIRREPFKSGELTAFAATNGLRLAGPAHIAVGILNGTVWHFAPIIAQATGKALREVGRRNEIIAKNVLSATQRLLHLLPTEGDAFSGPLLDPSRISLLHELAHLEQRASAAVQQTKTQWGSERAGQNDLRDLLGGALPSAFKLIFKAGTIAQRDLFINTMCQRVGLGIKDQQAIKQAVTRFKMARKKGAACNLPDWMGT